MARLDTELVRQKLISSRSRAQRAIKLGFVAVNGRVIKKSSFQVTAQDVIDVDVTADRPRGYLKLQRIQTACALIEAGDTVLDIGASAGGFLLYALEHATYVYALEFDEALIRGLDQIASRYPQKATIVHADAFTYDFGRFADCFDVILNDVTTEPESSLRLLARCSIALKAGGRVLQVLKGKISEEARKRYTSTIENSGYRVTCWLTGQKDELFIIGEKKQV